MADLYPEWNVVMVGPSTKLDPATLPRRANLHWLGGRPYSELPSYAKAFDVCLMPFALNEATEFINPTKALEYMATGRPIVSTAIADVVSNFGEVVHIARSANEFLEACRRCIQEPDQERIQGGIAQARNNTWESIVTRLEGHVQEALDQKAGKTFSHANHLNLSPKGGEIALPLPQLGK
jgi:glycosyltransferase involved in cell wall biosynthesis